MKLHHSPSSPFVRKVMAAAILRGLDGKIEKIPTNPHESPAHLLVDNPLSKIPALVTDDGVALIDSLVICEYLDTLGDAPRLIPAAGPERIKVLQLHAIADGLMDAAVARRGMAQLPQDDGRRAYDARQKGVMERSLAVLEQAGPQGLDNIGLVSIGCALGYLDFRYAHEPWRPTHPKLAAWFDAVKADRAFAETMPPA